MEQRFVKTSAYFFAAIFLLFLFINDKTILMVMITLAGLVWILDGVRWKNKTGNSSEDESEND